MKSVATRKEGRGRKRPMVVTGGRVPPFFCSMQKTNYEIKNDNSYGCGIGGTGPAQGEKLDHWGLCQLECPGSWRNGGGGKCPCLLRNRLAHPKYRFIIQVIRNIKKLEDQKTNRASRKLKGNTGKTSDSLG